MGSASKRRNDRTLPKTSAQPVSSTGSCASPNKIMSATTGQLWLWRSPSPDPSSSSSSSSLLSLLCDPLPARGGNSILSSMEDPNSHNTTYQLLQNGLPTPLPPPQMFAKVDSEVKGEDADSAAMARSVLEKSMSVRLLPWSQHEVLTEKPLLPLVSPSPSPSPLFQLADEAKRRGDVEVGVVADRAPADKASRLPRWSRHETLVLVEVKRVAEATLKRKKEEMKKAEQDEKGRDGCFKLKGVIESKWLLISAICKQRGVDREPNQCRKRWGNLFGDYKRIKEWQRLGGREPFWMMRSDARKENKLPSTFDLEVFEAMERLMGRKPVGTLSEMLSESAHPVLDEVLFSDIEHPVQEDAAAAVVAMGVHSCTAATVVGNSTPACDACERRSPPEFLGWKKRKQPSSVEPEDGKDPLLHLVESSCKQLISHLEANNQTIHLDRAERKEQSESLLGVLDKLADVLVKIADKL